MFFQLFSENEKSQETRDSLVSREVPGAIQRISCTPPAHGFSFFLLKTKMQKQLEKH
jgi:hypothetical protein